MFVILIIAKPFIFSKEKLHFNLIYRLKCSFLLVRLKGLGPTRIAAREPKSRMSTNSITGAYSIFLDFSSRMVPEVGTLSYYLYKQKITLFAIEQNQSSSHL